MSARTPREMAQEIVWQWMTTSLDDFTRSCIDDRGATLIEAIATALATAEAAGWRAGVEAAASLAVRMYPPSPIGSVNTMSIAAETVAIGIRALTPPESA